MNEPIHARSACFDFEVDFSNGRALQGQGFRVKFSYTTVTDPAQDQIVLDQNPESGQPAKPGSTVTLVVGKCPSSGCPATTTTDTTTTTTP